jgi:hypothetical protein
MGDQAVLPPTEFARSSHKAAERMKRSFLYFSCVHGEILQLWASRISLNSALVDNFKIEVITVISSTHL